MHESCNCTDNKLVIHKYWEHSVQGHLRMLCADFLIKDGITWENAVSELFINAAV